MVEQRISNIINTAKSVLPRLHREPKPKNTNLPEGMHSDLAHFTGTKIRNEYGFLRIDEENGCSEGTCVDVTLDARPSPWEAGIYLHAHLLATNQARPGWQVTLGEGMGSEEELMEVLRAIRERLVEGANDPKYLQPPSRFKQLEVRSRFG